MAKNINKCHWLHEDYKERITTKAWREMLLNDNDTIIYKGNIRRIVGKNLGVGVIEISKEPLPSSTTRGDV